jgi:hypothetical protein
MLLQEFALQILKHLSGEFVRINDGFDIPQNKTLLQLFSVVSTLNFEALPRYSCILSTAPPLLNFWLYQHKYE